MDYIGDGSYLKHVVELVKLKKDYCVFDFETSGLKWSEGARPITIAAWRISPKGKILAKLETAIRHQDVTREIDPKVQKITGYNLARLRKEGRPAPDVMRDFVKLARDTVLMGHNIINFDIGEMGNNELKRQNIRFKLDTKMSIDTLLMAKLLLQQDRYNLRAVADSEACQIKTDPSMDHQAWADVETSYLIFTKLYPRAVDAVKAYSRKVPNQYYQGFHIEEKGLWKRR